MTPAKRDRPIFGLRYDANEKLLPSHEELRIFLENAQARHGDDLKAYRQLIADLQAFEQREPHDASPHDMRNNTYYGVLSVSCFVNHTLLSAVLEYQYHLAALLSLDFRKPASFIRSAEEEMKRFNPRKKDEAAKLDKMKRMVEDRKKAIEELKKQWAILTAELNHIARYIRDNLHKIGNFCEAAIVLLVDFQLQRRQEAVLIEDVKSYFKDQLRESLQQGAITKLHLEEVKKDVDALSKEISAQVREDVYAISGLCEAIYDHVKGKAGEINALITRIEEKSGSGSETLAPLFAQLGRVLVALISEYRFELNLNLVRTETAHKTILHEKRKEMLAHLFKLLETERRSPRDRRSAADRRKFSEADSRGLERRRNEERRTGNNRRKTE
jgi:hypothetical protein